MMPEVGTDGPAGTLIRRSNLFSARAAGIAGLIFAALTTASFLLLYGVLNSDPGADLMAWFTEDVAPTASVVTLYIIPFSGIAFLWFMAGLRDSAAWREDRLFDTVLLGSGFVFVAMLFASAAALAALLLHVNDGTDFAITEGDIRYARLMSFSLFNVFAARAAGVFVIVSSTILLRTKLLPRWIGIFGIALGLVLLLGMAFFNLLIFLFPAWTAVVSVAILVLVRGGSRGKDGMTTQDR